MRIKMLIKGDMAFQLKYGFYFVYAIFTLFYVLLLLVIPKEIRNQIGIILIYTDPAAIGLFFMGAIVLLEKSQNILNSIAVSPVKVSEYILSKLISLGLIAAIVAGIISLLCGIGTPILVMFSTFFGSFLFSMIGLMVAAKTNSLNQFIIMTVPFELICFVPPMLYMFLYKHKLMLLHPGCAIIHLLNKEQGFEILPVIILFLWILIIYKLTEIIVRRMFLSVGGGKL